MNKKQENRLLENGLKLINYKKSSGSFVLRDTECEKIKGSPYLKIHYTIQSDGFSVRYRKSFNAIRWDYPTYLNPTAQGNIAILDMDRMVNFVIRRSIKYREYLRKKYE